MADDASAAGFNPLTAIRNGGSAGFTSTTTPGNGLSAALSTAGNFLQNFDPFADAKREQESRYVEAQINNLNAQTGSFNRTALTPSGPVLRRPGSAALSLSMQQPPTPGKTTVTNPLPVGVVDHRLVDADAWEARYSDVGGWVGGAVNAFGDFSENLALGLDKGGRAAWKYLAKRPTGKLPASANLPAGNAFQLPPMWPTSPTAPVGNWTSPMGGY